MRSLFFLSLMFTIFQANAGDPKLTKGDLSFLKKATKVKVEFSYDSVAVGEFKNEQDYINKKVSEYNEKEPGRGDQWRENWFNDRNTRFEPKFLLTLNENAPKDLEFSEEGNSEIVMLVKTIFIEPGFNVGVARKNAYVNFSILFYNSSDALKTNPIAEIELLDARGKMAMGLDFDTGMRIAESYGKAGKDLGLYFQKVVK